MHSKSKNLVRIPRALESIPSHLFGLLFHLYFEIVLVFFSFFLDVFKFLNKLCYSRTCKDRLKFMFFLSLTSLHVPCRIKKLSLPLLQYQLLQVLHHGSLLILCFFNIAGKSLCRLLHISHSTRACQTRDHLVPFRSSLSMKVEI